MKYCPFSNPHPCLIFTANKNSSRSISPSPFRSTIYTKAQSKDHRTNREGVSLSTAWRATIYVCEIVDLELCVIVDGLDMNSLRSHQNIQ